MSGWTAPVAIPSGSGSAPISRPAIRANTTGILVAAWRRAHRVDVTARFFGGPWTRPRSIATTGDAAAPQLVSEAGTVALGVAAGSGRVVRVARWTGGLAPVIDGPPGATGARGVRLAALSNHELVAVFGRGRDVVWSAVGRHGAWSRTRVLFAAAAGVSLATGPGGAVLATSLRTSARGTSTVAALRSAGAPFGPASTSPPLGPRGSVTSVASAIRQDGRTGLVVGVRGGAGAGEG